MAAQLERVGGDLGSLAVALRRNAGGQDDASGSGSGATDGWAHTARDRHDAAVRANLERYDIDGDGSSPTRSVRPS